MFDTTFLEQFKTENLGAGLTLVKHKITGDALVYGQAVGIGLDQAESWKRNYSLPVISSINTRFLPPHGGQLDVRPVNFEEYKKVRLVSYIADTGFEACVSEIYGKPIQYSDAYLRLGRGQSALLARYSGPRIVETNGVLPENGRMDFFLVRLILEHAEQMESF